MATDTVRASSDERTSTSPNGPAPRARHHLMGTELINIPLKIESKRLYLSLRENERGRFLKISEAETASGQKHKMIIPSHGISQLKDLVSRVAEEDQRLGASSTNKSESGQFDHKGPSKVLYSQRMNVSGKRFFFDLLVNSRGRYFKLSHVASSGYRVQITLPAAGLSAFASTIQRVIDEAPGNGKSLQNGPKIVRSGANKELHVEGKRIIFQTGSNSRGAYLRIVEKPGSSAVMMPVDCIPDAVDILLEISGAISKDDEDEDQEEGNEAEENGLDEAQASSSPPDEAK